MTDSPEPVFVFSGVLATGIPDDAQSNAGLDCRIVANT
jgi:hypothetical protein